MTGGDDGIAHGALRHVNPFIAQRTNNVFWHLRRSS